MMNVIVPRTCTVIPPGDEKRDPTRDSRPLSKFRDAPAYVLLGDPGSGKTTAFETECEALGEEACKVDARDFLELTLREHPEWRGRTLFIDGLDEVRVGVADVRKPFDRLRKRLEKLGRPRFRLSCREADWLGNSDWKRLTTVSPGSSVTVIRLDPLREADIRRILSAREGIGDPQAFVENARVRRIDGLLQNPLTLELLATVIARNEQWPESRLQAFEKACSFLVREHNEEHEVANRPANTIQLLDAVGRLCAVQLISGIEGYTQATGDPDSNFPSLLEIQYENPDALKSVLSTKLFKAETGSLNRFGPIHRHVSEYLGARYLARLIEGGLSVRRILSLITGEDGIVVTGLRGLSAWLAAHCKGARSVLIEQDPVGVGLYGDIRGFTFEEKEALLKALKREASRLGSIEIAPAFGPLATPDMERALRYFLSDPSREPGQQTFVDFVLRFLREGSPIPVLSDLLLDIVRDETRWPGINVSALDAFVLCEDEEHQVPKLKTLLKEIEDGIVSDPDSDLLGILLWQLFPEELSTSEIWNHKASGKDEGSSLGYYYTFWETGLTQQSSPAQIAELLDALCERRSLPESHPRGGLRIEHFPPMLLAKGLEYHGDQLDVERLYAWLDAFRWAHHYVDQDVGEIRSWLEQRPDLQKKVTLEGLKPHPESGDLRYRAVEIQEGLFDAAPPADFGVWCLKRALAMASRKPRVAEHLLELAWRCHSEQRGHEGLSLDLLDKHASRHQLLMTRLAQLRGLGDSQRSDRVEDRGRREERYIDRRRRQEEEWLDYLRANETALRENRAAPALLHEIAEVYFGNFLNFNVESAIGSIERQLRGASSLIEAALLGLRLTIEREDIPELNEILDLRENGREHYLERPFLAGLAEVERTTPEDTPLSDDGRIRSAIAFYYCAPRGEYRPDWYAQLLEKRPDIVADVQVRFSRSELRCGRHGFNELRDLVEDPAHAQVARLASLPLLRAFPTRCNAEQIQTLDNLLWAAIQHADSGTLQKLVETKSSRSSMNIAQRVRWLVTAAILSQEKNLNPLVDFVQGRERRVRYLLGFFPSASRNAVFSLADVELGNGVLEGIVSLSGDYIDPDQLWIDDGNENMGGRFGPQLQSAVLVYNFIQRLAASSEKDAGLALDRLLEDNTLLAWRDVLSRARDSQRVIQRDASYRHPEPEQVCRILDSDSPANAADLAALLVDRLDEISRQIETGNTDDWRQYWNEGPHGRPCSPKGENSCRDALLSDLRVRLSDDLDAQPEGQYARDRRADIRVSSGQNFQVPVEIKKNNHPDLWNAIRTQLIAKYTRDPAAAGQGIYLVFWFGKAFARRSPSGSRPDTPDELGEQLKATLSDEEARRISVVVVDVSGEESTSG